MVKLQRLLAAPDLADEEQGRRARLLHVMLLSAGAALAFWTAGTFAVPALRYRGTKAFIFLAVLVVAFLLNKAGRTRLATAVLVYGLWTSLHLGWLLMGAVRELIFAWSLLMVMAAALLLGRRAAIGLACLSAVTDVFVSYLAPRGRLPPGPTGLPALVIGYLAIITVSLALVYVASHSIEDALVLARHELEERRRAASDLQQKVKELTLLGAVATIAAEAESEESLIARATEVIRDSLFPDNCGVALLDEAAGVLRYAPSFHTSRPKRDHPPVPLGTGVIGQVALSGRPRLVRDAQADPDYVAADPGMRSELCVPLIVESRILGILDVESRRLDAFTESDERVLFTLGCLLATAIERLRATVALGASEEHFRSLVQMAWDVISIHDVNLCATYVSPSVRRVLGYEPSELLGWNTKQLAHPDDAERATVALGRLIASAGPEPPLEVRLRKADGSWAWVEVVGINLLGVPAVHGIVLTARDVSDRRRAQDALRQSEAALRHAAAEWRETFDGLPLGVLVVDEAGRILRANRPATDRAKRVQPQELVGLGIDQVDLEQPWPALAEAVLDVRAGRPVAARQARHAPSGATWLLSASRLVRDGGGSDTTILHFQDISKTVALRERLQQSETMAAIGSLLAGVAHEVRNPLFSISVNLDVLEGEIAQGQPAGESLGIIHNEVARLSHLMADLLEYGRPTQEAREPGSLADVVSRAAGSSGRVARERQVQLAIHVAPDLPAVPMQQKRLVQVFQNLIENAAQHAPPGSTVATSATCATRAGSAFVRCLVEDEGPGFRPEDVPRLFEPFFSRRRGGTGMGLSIVRKIVQEHGGTIQAENREEGGARMVVHLPLSEVDVRAEAG